MTKIYTKTGCPYCAAAKDDFTTRGLKYEEINLTEHPDRLDELVKVSGGRLVPVIVQGERVTVGYGGG